MIDTKEIGAGSYPEPDWCYEEITYCDLEDEDYDDWYADFYHDEMMIGGIDNES